MFCFGQMYVRDQLSVSSCLLQLSAAGDICWVFIFPLHCRRVFSFWCLVSIYPLLINVISSLHLKSCSFLNALRLSVSLLLIFLQHTSFILEGTTWWHCTVPEPMVIFFGQNKQKTYSQIVSSPNLHEGQKSSGECRSTLQYLKEKEQLFIFLSHCIHIRCRSAIPFVKLKEKMRQFHHLFMLSGVEDDEYDWRVRD